MRGRDAREILSGIGEDIDRLVNPSDKVTTGFCVLVFPINRPLERRIDSISNIASLTELAAILRREADILEETLKTEGPPDQ